MSKAYRKYNFTERMDEEIRRAYIERPANGAIPGVVDLSAKWDIPTWTIKRRAADLGLTREKNPVWSSKEIELLEKYAHLPCAVIARKFAKQWLFRSADSIKLKLRRLKIRRKANDDYDTRSLAEGFGVDESVVRRWIRAGLLKAEVVQTRADGQQRRLIKEEDVREFIFANPVKFDIRKVEQIWFMDLIAAGKISYSVEKAVK